MKRKRSSDVAQWWNILENHDAKRNRKMIWFCWTGKGCRTFVNGKIFLKFIMVGKFYRDLILMERRGTWDVGEWWNIVGSFCCGCCSVFLLCLGLVGILCFVFCLTLYDWVWILSVRWWWNVGFGCCRFGFCEVEGNLRFCFRLCVQYNCRLCIYFKDRFPFVCEIVSESDNDFAFR